MNENRFTKLFKKYNWEVEELGDNSYIAYNDIYFVPFSCVASTEVLYPCQDKYINAVCYLEIDKDEFVNTWKKMIENGYQNAIGNYAVHDFFSNKSEYVGITEFVNYIDFELDLWLESLQKSMIYINNNSIKKYDPASYGAVIAIRIYYKDSNKTPYADLVFPNGKYTTIIWTHVNDRKKYASGITGYTLFYDEREKREFKEWLKK